MIGVRKQSALLLVLLVVVDLLSCRSQNIRRRTQEEKTGEATQEEKAGEKKGGAEGAVAHVEGQEGKEGEGEGGEGGEGEGGEGEEGKEGEEEGEEEEGEEEEEVDATSLASASLLMGLMVFVMGIFYLVNHKDPDIVKTTWSMIDTTVSIFLAVTWYQAIDSFLDELDIDHHRVLVGLVHFGVWYALVVFGTYVVIGKKFHMKAISTVGAHVTGFAAKELFTTLQESHLHKSVGLAFLSVVISGFFAVALCLLTGIARVKHIEKKGKGDDWHEAITDVENDMGCLSVAFVLTQAIRFAILGEMPPSEMENKGHPPEECGLLLACTIIFLVLTMVVVHLRCKKVVTNKRLGDVAVTVLIMSMAWCVLYWGQWHLYGVGHFEGHEILARVLLAFLLSVSAVILIFTLETCSHKFTSMGREFHVLIKGFALAVAFSWEQAFDVAVEDVAEGIHTISAAGMKFIVGIFVIGFVGPAYLWYIAPHNVEEDEEEEEEGEEECKEEAKTTDDKVGSPEKVNLHKEGTSPEKASKLRMAAADDRYINEAADGRHVNEETRPAIPVEPHATIPRVFVNI